MLVHITDSTNSYYLLFLIDRNFAHELVNTEVVSAAGSDEW